LLGAVTAFTAKGGLLEVVTGSGSGVAIGVVMGLLAEVPTALRDLFRGEGPHEGMGSVKGRETERPL
jgi:hypothetical protein